MKKLLWLLVFLGAGVFVSAQAATYDDVTLPDSVNVGGKSLVLNGMGLRKFLFVSVYVGALYLPQKATTADAVMAEAGPFRVVMSMKHDVSHKQFADNWLDDLKANNPNQFPKLQSQAQQFVALFGDAKDGDAIVMDYVPGQGLSVSYNGKLMGSVANDDFARAVLHCYVGPNPPTERLKEGMLGGEG